MMIAKRSENKRDIPLIVVLSLISPCEFADELLLNLSA
jgi:hypothetical protein